MLPSISIIVPNFNGGSTIGQTLQSLLDQEYPSLEIYVCDGGSTDNSIDVIRSFEPHLAGWLSGPDEGQSDAINKGIARTTGEIVNWLCSDDQLAPGALRHVGEAFAGRDRPDVVIGACQLVYLDDDGQVERTWLNVPDQRKIDLIPCGNPIAQPSCFFRRSLLEQRAAAIDTTFHYAMDFELWAFFRKQQARWHVTEQVLSRYPFSGENKTSTGGEKIIDEIVRLYESYVDERVPLTFWHRLLRHPLERFQTRHRHWPTYPFIRAVEIALVLGLGAVYGVDRVRAMNWRSFVS